MHIDYNGRDTMEWSLFWLSSCRVVQRALVDSFICIEKFVTRRYFYSYLKFHQFYLLPKFVGFNSCFMIFCFSQFSFNNKKKNWWFFFMCNWYRHLQMDLVMYDKYMICLERDTSFPSWLYIICTGHVWPEM